MTQGAKRTLRESATYVAIGAIASTTDGSLYLLFTRALGMYYLAANFASVNVGITVSFLLNAYVNFRKTHRLFMRAISFYGICYFGMLVSMTVLFVGTSRLGLDDIPVKVAAVLLAGTVQFLFNKFVTFGRI